MFSRAPECSKQLLRQKLTANFLGHRIHAKISPKAASEKAQTTVSGNRYTNPIIDVFRTVILLLLVSTGNSVRAPFLVHQVPRTSATVLRYRQVFTQFSFRIRVSDYTCHPMIADLPIVDICWQSIGKCGLVDK